MGNEDKGIGTLYICATPIGNLEDISLRVLRVLREVDIIAAEDTRHTRKLLSHYEISTNLTSYHKHNELSATAQLVNMLCAGQDVALVSDAGLPGISDPGQGLIDACYESGIAVTICPGATAGVAGLVLSGLCTKRYVFEGFLPRKKKERRKVLEGFATERRTVVLYEAPHRLHSTLCDMNDFLGDRQVAIVREITKKFEEVRKGLIVDLIEHYKENPPRGEFVLVIEGCCSVEDFVAVPNDLSDQVRVYVSMGVEEKEAMKIVAKERGVSKSVVYSAYKIVK